MREKLQISLAMLDDAVYPPIMTQLASCEWRKRGFRRGLIRTGRFLDNDGFRLILMGQNDL